MSGSSPFTTHTLRVLRRRGYVRFFNARHRRTGTLWEGRYRAAPIDSDRYFIACCRYIEFNPVREVSATGCSITDLQSCQAAVVAGIALATDDTGSGTTAERDGFDAWGAPRNIDGSDDTTCSKASVTTRGFTNQEEINALCLVNLNARIYDPTIGRFMVPDDVIPDTYNGQSLNRYTYVDNGPLSYEDPTGHEPGRPRDAFIWVPGPLSNLNSGWSSAPTLGLEVQSGPGRGHWRYEMPLFSDDVVVVQTTTTEMTETGEVMGSVTSTHISFSNDTNGGFQNAAYARIHDTNGGGWLAAAMFGMGHNGGPPLEDALGTGLRWGLRARLLTGVGTFLAVMAPQPLNGGETLPTPPSFPTNPSQLQHIFRNAEGHFAEDTPENRAQIQMTVNQADFSHVDSNGNSIYGGLNSNGTQTWVSVRNGIIQNAGLNQTPQNLIQRFPP